MQLAMNPFSARPIQFASRLATEAEDGPSASKPIPNELQE